MKCGLQFRSTLFAASTLMVLLIGTVAGPTALAAQHPDPSILQTVEALYTGMSGDEGEDRDWQEWSTLFMPGARFVSVRAELASPDDTRTWSVPEWIVQSGLGIDGRGFVEEMIHDVTESYGGVASVFTSYVARRSRGGPETGRGAAAFQLANTDEGWKIVTMVWTGEQENNPLPERYLP